MSRHGSRLVVLIDAKAVLGAATKGRSSSPSLLRIMRSAASHILATNMLIRLVYVPSEDNPADAPSRGIRRRPRIRRTITKKRTAALKSKLEKHFDRIHESNEQALRDRYARKFKLIIVIQFLCRHILLKAS